MVLQQVNVWEQADFVAVSYGCSNNTRERLRGERQGGAVISQQGYSHMRSCSALPGLL